MLKRKLSYRTPFDEMYYRKNMSRMRERVQSLEQEIVKNEKKKRAAVAGAPDTPLDMVENTLHLVT